MELRFVKSGKYLSVGCCKYLTKVFTFFADCGKHFPEQNGKYLSAGCCKYLSKESTFLQVAVNIFLNNMGNICLQDVVNICQKVIYFSAVCGKYLSDQISQYGKYFF